MPFPWLAAATFGSAALGFAGQSSANEANAEEARKNRAFQRRAYKHRYQWQVRDMRKAGLNPALAYENSPGGVPGGSMAHMENALEPASRAAMGAISSALEVRQARAQIENIQAQTKKTEAETNQLTLESTGRAGYWGAKAGREESEADLVRLRMLSQRVSNDFLQDTYGDRVAIVGLEREQAASVLSNLKQELELRGLERAPLEAQAEFAKTWYGKNVAPYVNSAGGIVGAMTGLINPFLRYLNGRQGPNQGKPGMKPNFNRRYW